jgi:AcrR family transcriptional regulator
MSISQQDSRGSGAAGEGLIAPLYKRLPRGPHRLDRGEVVHHQRIRLHGAMVEAVAANGYEQTSVKQVIALAGVSRRAFYEQFANKEACFLATFDLIATRGIRRIGSAYRSTEGDLEERMHKGFAAYTEEIDANAKCARLVIVDAQTAGPAGLLRLRRATATFERLFSKSFLYASDTDPLPLPVVRAIVGGLRRATFLRLRDWRTKELIGLTQELMQWALLFQSPAARHLEVRPCPGSLSSTSAARRARAVARSGEGERARLMRSVVRLAVKEDYAELSAPQIADEAEVPIDAFFDLFADRDDCFLAALDMVGAEILDVVADPLLDSEWHLAVPRAIEALMRYLVANPDVTQTIALETYSAGPRAIGRAVDLAQGLAALLTAGVPESSRSSLAVEGIAGAIWHTVHTQVATRKIHLLPALCDYLSYVVLASFIDAKEAAQIVMDIRARPERPGITVAYPAATSAPREE